MKCSLTGNALLDLIARSENDQGAELVRTARRVDFKSGQKLQSAGEPLKDCFFPATGVLTLLSAVSEESSITTLTIGFDGAIHANPGTQTDAVSQEVISRISGYLWQVDAARWHALMESNVLGRQAVTTFTDFLLRRTQQALACERRHDVESRVCKSLLDLHRWQRGNPLSITHQMLSELLGVRRTTITLIARSLQDAGLICCGRGTIWVVDAYALQQASCPCHAMQHPWLTLCDELPPLAGAA